MAKEYQNTIDITSIVATIQDTASSYDAQADPDKVSQQCAALRYAAIQLLNATSSPEETIWRYVTSMAEMVSIRTALRIGVFKAIPLEGVTSLSELSDKVNTEEAFLERLMRILVGSGTFDQTQPDGGDYLHTELSRTMVDVTIPGPGSFFQTLYDVYLRPMVSFDEFVVDTAKDGVFREPTSNWDNPFTRCYGKSGQHTWEAIANVPDVMKVFQVCMRSLDAAVPPRGPGFNFNQFKATSSDDDRIQLVDVGGGYGKVLQDILLGNSDLDPRKCVLEDMSHVIELAATVKALGVQTRVIDFNKEQPVKGARAYYMRMISHDYGDETFVNILTHISEAMAPDSKLLINDQVMPDRLDFWTMKGGVMDQLMMNIGGKERTESNFARVLAKAGLELTEVHRVPASGAGIVECRKAAK